MIVCGNIAGFSQITLLTCYCYYRCLPSWFMWYWSLGRYSLKSTQHLFINMPQMLVQWKVAIRIKPANNIQPFRPNSRKICPQQYWCAFLAKCRLLIIHQCTKASELWHCWLCERNVTRSVRKIRANYLPQSFLPGTGVGENKGSKWLTQICVETGQNTGACVPWYNSKL